MDLGLDLKIHNEIGQYLTQNQWKWMKFDNKISWKSMKSWPKFKPNSEESHKKISYFWDKIHRKSIKILSNPLIEIERKSAKIDNKLTQNQWKSSSKLRENQLKLNQILIKLIIKLSSNSAKKWDNIWNNGFTLRGHFHVYFPKILGG